MERRLLQCVGPKTGSSSVSFNATYLPQDRGEQLDFLFSLKMERPGCQK